jgi:hypothetical protein
MADLAIGATACIAFWRDLGFKAAAVSAASIFLARRRRWTRQADADCGQLRSCKVHRRLCSALQILLQIPGVSLLPAFEVTGSSQIERSKRRTHGALAQFPNGRQEAAEIIAGWSGTVWLNCFEKSFINEEYQLASVMGIAP